MIGFEQQNYHLIFIQDGGTARTVLHLVSKQINRRGNTFVTVPPLGNIVNIANFYHSFPPTPDILTFGFVCEH